MRLFCRSVFPSAVQSAPGLFASVRRRGPLSVVWQSLAWLSVAWLSGLLLCASPLRAQSSYELYGSARASALGYATTALATDAGGHANPAVRSARSTRVASFFARQSFGLAELRYGAAHIAEPTRWGTFSVGAGTFGFDAYREVHLNAGGARGFSLGTSRRLHAGVNVRYYHTSIQDYGSAGAVGLGVGLLVAVLPTLDFGAHATNVNAPSLTPGEDLPRTLAVGLSYAAAERLRVVADVFKDVDFPASLRGGVEARPVDVLALRAGVASAPNRFTAGAGVRLNRLRVDVAAEQHLELGWSPSASLAIVW